MAAAKLNRDLFRESMPSGIVSSLIKCVQNHPALPKKDKDWVCDCLQNYEHLDTFSKNQVLDIIDEMEFFVFGK